MQSGHNQRGHQHHVVDNQHLKLNDLKTRAQHLRNSYLIKENIPPYPQPEFHVRQLRHDTGEAGLRGIRKDCGFKNPGRNPLLWWSLAVGPDEIESAERRLLETAFPDRMEEQAQRQQSFLGEFATSPAFKKTSRLGSYRFTFPLEELLQAYSEQFCSGAKPVMRVLRTVLYKQEVMYAVLVHSPAQQEEFSDFPLLMDDDPNAVCTYRDGCFIWRAQAMCETHRYELVLRPEEQQMEAQPASGSHQFYVWDNVAVALHVDNQVLSFESTRLRENLKFCYGEKPGIIRGATFEDFSQAEETVRSLWPDAPSPLEEDK